MKRKWNLLMILLSVVCLNAACGRIADTGNHTDTPQAVIITESTEHSSTSTENTESSFVSMEQANIAVAHSPLHVSKYIPFSMKDTEASGQSPVFYSAAYGEELYLLLSYQSTDSAETIYAMYHYAMGMEAPEQIHFTIPFSSEDYRLYAMKVTGKEELSFILYKSHSTDLEPSYYLCKTKTTGQLLEEISPLTDNNAYLLESWEKNTRMYPISDGTAILTECRPDTVLTEIYRYDIATAQRTLIDNLPNEFIHTLCSNGGDELFFISNNYLIQYDIKNKQGAQKWDLRECGILLYGAGHLLVNPKGELALFIKDGDKPGIYHLSQEAPTNSDALRLVRLQTYGMEYVTKQAGMFAYDGGHTIRIEKEDDVQAQEAFRDRILAEIVAGGGPELLWVSEEDLYMLAGKGAIMDISSLLPQDVTQQLLPGVLQLGTVKDKLFAITPEVSFHTLVTNNEVWKEEGWNAQELMKAAETKDNWELSFGYTDLPLPAGAIFAFLFSDTLGNSPYIDLEQGISYFEQQDFIDILEFCKKYGQENLHKNLKSDERTKLLREGKSIAHINYYYNGIEDFSSRMYHYGENCHIVGYPVQEGSGNYLYSEGYLVVNANAVHIKEIKEFIRYLLDYEHQFSTSWTPVRMDVLRDRVVKMPYPMKKDEAYAISMKSPNAEGTPVYLSIKNKPDGSSYLEEFMSFAESCEPLPYCPDAIKKIVSEETKYFFDGTKSAKETTAIIHSRVQLYLDEQY